ncbi:flagellar biosynthetic protein FliO, partial [Balneolaceae bacterium ANBcel3]|nr:flagellar biosynthetic protein FliO [Balneolaceae bacterium ANBcel3]
KLGTTSSATLFKEVGSQQLAPGKQLKVMEINNEIWVLGMGSDSITLLHRYPKDEWKDRSSPDDSASGSTFFELFSSKS